MGGRFSRRKGATNERALVIHLANKHYQAERILRQYQVAGQPDVRAVKDGKEYTFEMKARRCSFKRIYDLYYRERDGENILAFVQSSSGIPVAVSTDFQSLLEVNRSFRNLTLFPPDKKLLKVFDRIVKFNAWRQTADFLVIRDNGKPMLFLRYWGV